MGVWGATAGLATVTGPLLGGLLVDTGGWPWIFYVNAPVGIVGLILAWIFVPKLERTNRNFDWVGTGLSAFGMFCLVFGIQEAQRFGWDWRFWALLAAGAVLLAAFGRWQTRRGDDALVPLRLFTNRNFTLAGLTIATVGFAVSTFAIPWMIYVQTVQEFTPTHAALLVLPSGIVSFFLSPQIGKLTNSHDPKPFAIAGLSTAALAIAMTALIATPAVDPRWMYLASVLYGVGNSMMWGPLSMVATRNLEPALAGAGSSVYNTMRQIGAVIGSAAVAAMISAQLNARLGDNASAAAPGAGGGFAGPLPEALHEPFAQAMSTTIWLPCAVLLAGAALACGFAKTQSWNN
ncbi:MFS transporter [Corynebacterium aquatimens]|uniref:MFS transporter n=1 Tax=Corynebacterium aquatimens TaxID=1190508 RepID=UPI0025407F9F|nr:MFS transporter [Corynebacterium aquatimens]